jgi:hypothetical protein
VLETLPRQPWEGASGYVAEGGPLVDWIEAVEVRTAGDDAAGEVVIIFKHPAFPGRLFGLRSGALWTPLTGDAVPWNEASDVLDVGLGLAMWAQDFGFLHGPPVDVEADAEGVTWVQTTWREQVGEKA